MREAQLSALGHLNQLADEARAAGHPVASQLLYGKYSDKSPNDLSRCIVDYLWLFCGHFTTRLPPQPDLGRYILTQLKPLPEIIAIVNRDPVFIKIKQDDGPLSDAEKATITALEESSAFVYIARNFEDFYQWFAAEPFTIAD